MMLWNEQQIHAEYLQDDPVSRESMYGKHVVMTPDATTFLVSAPGSCKIFVYTSTNFDAEFGSQQSQQNITVRETINNGIMGTNSNSNTNTNYVNSRTTTTEWEGLLIGPKNLPSYAYPPFYLKNEDSAVNDGRNVANPNPKNTDVLNRRRASEEDTKIWKKTAFFTPPPSSELSTLEACKAAKFGGNFHGVTGSIPLSILNYDGFVTIGNLTIRVVVLAAVGASDESTGNGAVYVYGQAHPVERYKLPKTLDFGDGWFYQNKFTSHVQLSTNIKAYFGYSVALSYIKGENTGVVLLTGGRGMNCVVSFFLPSRSNSTLDVSVGSNIEGSGGNYSWIIDHTLDRILEDNQTDTDRFGDSLRISSSSSGTVAAVGAPNYLGGTGRAYVFRMDLNSRRWIQVAALLPEGPRPGNLFGFSLAISDNHVAVGMCAGTDPKQAAGVVHVYKLMPTKVSNYSLQARLTPSVRSGGDDFGCSIAMVQTKVPLVGAAVIASSRGNTDYYKTDIFVGAWNSMASATGSGLPKARKGAIHTFVTKSSNMQIDDGYLWEEGPLLAMFERSGGSIWDEDPKNNNNVPSHFGRSISVSADAKNMIIGHAREDVYTSTPNVYNENPGMVLYFHDKFIDVYEVQYLLLAVNSFLIMLVLILIGGCCSICTGAVLKRSRNKRLHFYRFSYGSRRYNFIENSMDSSDHKSLLKNEVNNENDSDESNSLDLLDAEEAVECVSNGDGNGSLRNSSMHAQLQAPKKHKQTSRPLFCPKLSTDVDVIANVLGSHNAAKRANEDTDDMFDLPILSNNDTGDINDTAFSVRSVSQADKKPTAIMVNRLKAGGSIEEARVAETVAGAGASARTGNAPGSHTTAFGNKVVPTPSDESLGKDVDTPMLKATAAVKVAEREAEMVVGRGNAVAFSDATVSKSKSYKRGTIINIAARDMILDLLLSLSLSVCSASFLYLLYLRSVISIFRWLLVAHVLLGFLPCVIVVFDIFYPAWIRASQLSVLWSGLETFHLVLRNQDNYGSVYLRKAYNKSNNLDKQLKSGYPSFVWGSFNKPERFILIVTILGGGGALMSTLRFLPWRQTLFSVYSSGYPTLSVLKYAEYPTSLLYIAYATVLLTALWGSHPSDDLSVSVKTYAQSDIEPSSLRGGDASVPESQQGVFSYGSSDQPLSSLSLSLQLLDLNDWALQRAGYPPQHLDIISSGGWLALTFFVLCCVQLVRSFVRFLLPMWMKNRGKWELMWHLLYSLYTCCCNCICSSYGDQASLGTSRQTGVSFSGARQLLNEDDDDDYIDDSEESAESEDELEDGHLFGLSADGKLLQGRFDSLVEITSSSGKHKSSRRSEPVVRTIKRHVISNSRSLLLGSSASIELVERGKPTRSAVHEKVRPHNISDEDRAALRRDASLYQQRLLRPRSDGPVLEISSFASSKRPASEHRK